MKKRGELIFVLIILLIVLTLTKSNFALTTSPSQIMIPSEYIKSNTEMTTDMFIELETNEASKEISFKIPDEYKKNVRIEPSKFTLRKKSSIKIKVYNLQNLAAGEHNIDIQILESNKPITEGINTDIFIKVVAPEKNEIIKSNNTDSNGIPIGLILTTTIIAIAIITTTIVLSSKISKIKKAKEEYFSDKFETRLLEQESKVDLLISETTNLLENIK